MKLEKLNTAAHSWLHQRRQIVGYASAYSPFWSFAHDFDATISQQLSDFKEGNHTFEPMKQIRFPDKILRLWSYPDRLITHLIHQHIKPTFKHVISSRCTHLSGPSSIKSISRALHRSLASGKYHYVCRMDIKSYYASIDHATLLAILTSKLDDATILKYLEAIITIGIDINGEVTLPTKGLPLGSSLSPFFGALYLDDLDRAFENKADCFYYRYMDDIIILVKTKRQFQKARKTIFRMLKSLKLTLSRRKSLMGALVQKGGFHYLGINYQVTQTPDSSKTQVQSTLHPRTCRRARDKAQTLTDHAVNPADIQRYLKRWATWWHFSDELNVTNNLTKWTREAATHSPDLAWLGHGLLLNAEKPSLIDTVLLHVAIRLGPSLCSSHPIH
jgi:hypothetical protein